MIIQSSSSTIEISENRLTVAILGAGRFGRALCNRLRSNAVMVRSGTWRPTTNQYSFQDAVIGADVVVLALPKSSHLQVARLILPFLSTDAIVVDTSNHALYSSFQKNVSIAENLQNLLPGVSVAKAFNTLSADILMDRKRTPSVLIASESPKSAEVLAKICYSARLIPVHIGGLSSARLLERIPHKLFPKWQSSFILSCIIMSWWVFYITIVSYMGRNSNGIAHRSWNQWPLDTFNRATAETAMTLFSLTFLPVPVAGMIHLVRGSTSKPFGSFFGGWLDMRKELGITSICFASLHVAAGTIINSQRSSDTFGGGVCAVLGIISFALFALLASCNSNSVNEHMSWREFRVIFSYVGASGFMFGILHQGMYVYRSKDD